MQAQIRRTPNGHYLLHCALVQTDGWALPESWTHIELELDHLRILCALPEHPRPQECVLRDARLSSWLRAKVHSGKLFAEETVALDAVYEGVYRVAAGPRVQPALLAQAAVEPARKTLAETPKVRTMRTGYQKLLPRPVRHAGLAAAAVASAS